MPRLPTVLCAALALAAANCASNGWRPPMDEVRPAGPTEIDLATYQAHTGVVERIYLRREVSAPPEAAEAYPCESDACGRREGVLVRLGVPDLSRYIAEPEHEEPREFFKWPGDAEGNNAGFFLEFDPPLVYLPDSVRPDQPAFYEGRFRAFNRWGHPARAGSITRRVNLEGQEDVSALGMEYRDCVRLRADTRIRPRWGPNVDVTEYLWLAPRVGVVRRIERIKGITFPLLFENAWVSELVPSDAAPARLATDRAPMAGAWKRAAIYMEPLLPNPCFAGMSVEYHAGGDPAED